MQALELSFSTAVVCCLLHLHHELQELWYLVVDHGISEALLFLGCCDGPLPQLLDVYNESLQRYKRGVYAPEAMRRGKAQHGVSRDAEVVGPELARCVKKIKRDIRRNITGGDIQAITGRDTHTITGVCPN